MKLSRNHVIPLFWSILIPAVGIGIYFLAYWNWSTLPDGIKLADEKAYTEPVFVAERARDNLRTLTSRGPRVVGSEANEVFAVGFLVETINRIIEEANDSYDITVEVQEASGSYFLDYKDYPITGYYRGVQNVVATLRKRSFSGRYLLLNAHFDSAVTSPGAGDDGTMSVVMLEILRQLSKHDLPLQHGIIFLFNGCEENMMQGAHGFVTGHRLASNVSAFINLDVAANGGREIMFQSGPNFPFLMNYYQKFAKRPYANSLGEEVFQLGLVPSFTDFETLSQVGNWPGMDFALASYGYLYHTKYDAFETISESTLQHIGDNLLPLTIGLAQAEELLDPERHREDSPTFFDFMHLFKITYNRKVSIAINCTVGIVGLGLIVGTIVMMVRMEGANLGQILMECGLTLIVQTTSVVAGAGLSLVVAVLVDLVGHSMSWFTSTWLLFGLYFVPFIIFLVLGPWLYITFRTVDFLNNQGRVLLFLHAQALIYIALLFTFTIGGIRSAYLLLFPIIFHSLTTVVNMIIKFKLNYWIYVHLAGQLIPLFYFCSLTSTVFAVFIPMTGRGDPAANPDLMMALFSVLMSLFLVGLCAPLVVLLSKIRYFFIVSGSIFAITIIVMFTSIGFPFREGTSPQRYYIFHQERNFFNYDTSIRRFGYNFFLYPMDRHTPDLLFHEVPIWRRRSSPVQELCDQELYCGFPFYINRYHRQREHSYWMVAQSRPYYPNPVDFRLTSKQDLTSTVRRFHITVEGPNLMGLYISPLKGYSLTAWTFSDSIPPSGLPWKGQAVHYVNLLQGKSRAPWEFFLDIESTDGSSLPVDGPMVVISLAAHYMFHEEHHTDEFRKLIDDMAPYMNAVAYPSYLESREF